MNKHFVLAVVACLVLISCQQTTTTPDPYEEPIIVKAANMVLDGDFTKTMTSYGCPQFAGYVKNIGNATGYNCMIKINCYSDLGKTTIVDVASGFPADLGDIMPGQRAYFDAVAFDLSSHGQIKAISHKITWLDRGLK